MTRVTIKHVRKLGYCVSGVRAWCDQHGFDFRKLVREGYTIGEISHIDDHNVRRVIDIVKQEEQADGEK